ncbi:MAG: helix-turn-helix domain-containing protein, partial [Candidatus Acidiferrales bacterium]
ASSVMEEKLRFVFEYEMGEHSMTELCQRYTIARETGYVWLRRYLQKGGAWPMIVGRLSLTGFAGRPA